MEGQLRTGAASLGKEEYVPIEDFAEEASAPLAGPPTPDELLTPVQRARRKQGQRDQDLVDVESAASDLAGAAPIGSREGAQTMASEFVQGAVGVPAGVLDWGGIALGYLGKLAHQDWSPAQGGAQEFAEAIRNVARKAIPESERLSKDFLASTLPQALGSSASFLLGGAVLRALGASPTLGIMGLGAATQGAAQYHDAKMNGADDRQALTAFALGTGVGTSEAFPLGKMLDRANKASGGSLKHALLHMLFEGTEELTQEGVSQLASNAIAKHLAKYDKDRKLTEGVLENAGAGGLSGVLLSALISAHGMKHVPEGGPKTIEQLSAEGQKATGAMSEGRQEGLPKTESSGTVETAGGQEQERRALPEVRPGAEAAAAAVLPGVQEGGQPAAQPPATEEPAAEAGPATPGGAEEGAGRVQPLPVEEAHRAPSVPEVREEADSGAARPAEPGGRLVDEEEEAAGGRVPLQEAPQAGAEPAERRTYVVSHEEARGSSLQPGDQISEIHEVPIGEVSKVASYKPEEGKVQSLMVAMRHGEPLPAILYSKGPSGQNIVDDGGHRLEAARRLGYETIPARLVTPKGQAFQALKEPLANEPATKAEAPSPAPEETREPKTTSIKNAVVDRELADMGLPPAEHGEQVADRDRYRSAKEKFDADPQAGARLVTELEAAQRPPTGDEGALLALEMNRLILEREAAQDAFNAEPSEENQARVDKATADYARAADVVTKTGTESSASLRIRKMMIARDYSLAAMERAMQVAKGGEPLTAEESAQVKELSEKIAAAEKAHAEYVSSAEARQAELEAENALLRLKREARQPARAKRRQESIAESRKKIDELLKQLAAQAHKARTGLDVDTLALTVKLAAEHIKIGYQVFAQWAEEMVSRIGEHIRPYLRPAWDRATKERQVELAEPVRAALKEGSALELQRAKIQRLAEHFVAMGVTDREQLVDAVHTVLQEADPKITRRQTMDAISGYGAFRQLSKDEVKRKLRDLKGQLQQVSKIEDLEKRVPPKKTGFERRATSDEERRLIQQVNDLKRRLGIRTTDPETQLKSSLDAIKARLKNQIADLQHEIDTRTPIVRERAPAPSDAQVEALKQQRDALKAQVDEIFSGRNQAQQLARAQAAVEKAIADLERRIASGDIAPRTQKTGPTSAALDAARARHKALLEELNLLRRAAEPQRSPEEIALQRYKTRKANDIARLQERTAAGEFGPRPRQAVQFDEEANRLRAQYEGARREFERAKERQRLKNRTRTQKVLDAAREAIDLPKAIMTAWDFSAVFRQGAFFTLGHPIITATKHVPAMVKAALSEKKTLEMDVALRNRPLAAFGEASKLELTRHGDNLGPREEAIRSRLSDKIPGLKGSNRAFVTFLNMQRAFMFDALVQSLPGTPTLEQGRAIANVVNVASGRGAAGKFAPAMSALAVPLWSPRLLLSRFQLLAGQPFYKGDTATRTRIAKEYGRFLIGLGGVYALAKLAGLWMPDDEKPQIEADPRSSDFGKVRIGSTRIDPLAGLSQVTVLLSRLISGETKRSTSGEIVPIRGEHVPYGSGTAADVVARFLRSKLSPTIGVPLDILSGENAVGEPVTPASAAKGLLVPLSFQDIYETLKQRGVPSAAAIGLLSIFGMGVQTYANKPATPAKVAAGHKRKVK